MLNLGYVLEETAKTHPDITAVILDQIKISYEQLNKYSNRVANILKQKGLKKGDKVAVMIPNLPYFPMVYYGILKAGGVVVPVNVLYQKMEIEHYIRDSEAVAFFVYHGCSEEAIKAFQSVDSCKHLIIIPPMDNMGDLEAGENFNKLLMEANDTFDIVQTMPDDTAVILYTSGTTGAPKGAELTHFNMFFNAYYASHEIVRVKPGTVALVVLPLFHSFGQTCVMNACIMRGGTMSMLPRFETQKAMEVIARDRINVLAMVPTMYAFILNAPNWQEFDFSCVTLAVSGGAALPADIHQRFQERYGITILEGYGLSETSPVASFTVLGEEVRVGSIGKPIWGVDMRIMRDDGTFAGPDEIGEIVIRGHNVMKGYYKRPEATAEVMLNDWFHTGDMGRTDKDGYFYIVDRKKELIIRGGMNIYPREIEEILYTHPKVLEAAVVGIPDKLRGEEVRVYVSPKEGEEIHPEEIMQFLQEKIAKFKWPKDVVVLPQLPKGPTGKILKRQLRSMPIV